MDHHQFHLCTTIRAYFVTYGHSCSRFLWIHIYMYKKSFLFQTTVFKSWKWLFMVCLMSCDKARSGFVLNTINERLLWPHSNWGYIALSTCFYIGHNACPIELENYWAHKPQTWQRDWSWPGDKWTLYTLSFKFDQFLPNLTITNCCLFE